MNYQPFFLVSFFFQSETELDDDAMFKFDEALIQVFKNMRKAKEAEAKENKQQLIAFKSRYDLYFSDFY